MAKLLITTDENEVIEVKGRMTFEVNKVETEDGEITLVASGQLSMHNYIDIVREVFGTNDFNILYEFVLTDGYSYEIKEDTLPEEAIKEIEDEEYKDDDSNKWEV